MYREHILQKEKLFHDRHMPVLMHTQLMIQICFDIQISVNLIHPQDCRCNLPKFNHIVTPITLDFPVS